MALSVLDQRSHYVDFVPLIAFEYQIDYFFVGIFHHLFAGNIASGMSGTGEKQAQEIVYFRGGAYGRTRIFVDGFLLYGYDRAQAADFIHIRTFERAEHVAGIA